MRLLRLTAVIAAAAASVWMYVKLLRPRVINWGATPEEVARAMPGDDLVPHAALQSTRSITIHAPPDAIWPWLVQIGPGDRAGIYTYDWLERLLGIDLRNADTILPQYQHLDVGEFFPLDGKGTGLVVHEAVPNSHLVLQWKPAGSSWTFAIYPEDGATRFVSRNRLPPPGFLGRLGLWLFMESASLVMERKMLLGFKERAERLRDERA